MAYEKQGKWLFHLSRYFHNSSVHKCLDLSINLARYLMQLNPFCGVSPISYQNILTAGKIYFNTFDLLFKKGQCYHIFTVQLNENS